MILASFFSSGVLEELYRNVQYTAVELNLIDIKRIFTMLAQQKSPILSSGIIIAIIKCTFSQVSIVENRFSGKCPFGLMYILASVRSGKCTFEILSIRPSVFQRNVHSGRCFSGSCTGSCIHNTHVLRQHMKPL